MGWVDEAKQRETEEKCIDTMVRKFREGKEYLGMKR